MTQPRGSLPKILLRSLRLRCPRCGLGRLYARWFRMHARCGACDCPFDRGAGFYLGAIYINYGLAAIISAVGFPMLVFSGTTEARTAFWVLLAIVVILPFFFLRHARALWLGFDEFLDPPE